MTSTRMIIILMVIGEVTISFTRKKVRSRMNKISQFLFRYIQCQIYKRDIIKHRRDGSDLVSKVSVILIFILIYDESFEQNYFNLVVLLRKVVQRHQNTNIFTQFVPLLFGLIFYFFVCGLSLSVFISHSPFSVFVPRCFTTTLSKDPDVVLSQCLTQYYCLNKGVSDLRSLGFNSTVVLVPGRLRRTSGSIRNDTPSY